MKSIAILDYGLGNIRSVSNALMALGAVPQITNDPGRIFAADGVILPGVGAFPSGMELLRQHGLVPSIHNYVAAGRPFLGICLGMQLLFDHSTEFGDTAGLGLIPGAVDKIPVQPGEGRLPHIAWTTIAHNPGMSETMFAGISEAERRFYFVHSFTACDVPNEFVTGSVRYLGHLVTAAVQRDNVWGTQFHPEKSGPNGLKLLTNFIGQC